MNEIPSWWFIVSGLFFVVNLVVLVMLTIIGMRMLEVMRQLKTKVDELSIKVNRLVDTVNSTAVKVDAIATNVQNTSQTISTKSASAMGAFENAALVGAPLLGKVMPVLNIALTALKVFQAYRAGRGPTSKTK